MGQLMVGIVNGWNLAVLDAIMMKVFDYLTDFVGSCYSQQL